MACNNCKPIIINNCGCCDCGTGSTGGGGTGADGKSPYIGENGNWFTWDGTEFVDTGVFAGQKAAEELSWCEGYFKAQSLAKGAYTQLTPIAQYGDLSLVSGQKLLCNATGIWSLTVEFTPLSVSTFCQPTIGFSKGAGNEGRAIIYHLPYTGDKLLPASAVYRADINDAIAYSEWATAATVTSDMAFHFVQLR